MQETMDSPCPALGGEWAGREPADTVVTIDYYTDPLCSWSWAFEPQWRRLRFELGEQVRWRYHMGGLLADWRQYADPLNAVSKPAQMGPQWYQVRALTGMPFDARIWQDDPPTSSYPACVAVTAVEQQGAATTERYLRRLREAVMLERRNIARNEVLVELAREVAATPAEDGRLDCDRFEQDLRSAVALDQFRQDMKDALYRGIGRFPTLTMQRADGRALIIVGYRPYATLYDAITHLAPEIALRRVAPSAEEYARFWHGVTARETAEALCCDVPAAQAALESLVRAGTVERSGASALTGATSEAVVYVVRGEAAFQFSPTGPAQDGVVHPTTATPLA